MSTKTPYYVIVRVDADPADAALAAVVAMEDAMGSEQANDLHNGYAQVYSVPDEARLRDLIAEAAINQDHLTVGTMSDGVSAVLAIIGPSVNPGPMLVALSTRAPNPGPKPESIAEDIP